MSEVANDRRLPWLLLTPGLACVALFIIAPILCMGTYSFWTRLPDGTIDQAFTLANWREIFADGFYWEILLKTVRFAFISTLVCAILGYGPAYFLTLQPPSRRGLLVILLLLPSWISYVIRTMSWMPVLGRAGLLNDMLMRLGLIDAPLDILYNDASVYIGMIQFLLPLMMLNIYLGLSGVDQNLVAAARTLGASRWQAFRAVTFPLSLPALSAGCLLCFILAMGTYITPLLLGGPGATYYSRLIYEEVVSQQNWPLGAALSVVIVLMLATFLGLYARFVGLSHMLRGTR